MNQIEVKFKSKLMMTKMPLCVLLPEAPDGERPLDYYVPGRKYPVLWLLHGATEDYDDWLENNDLLQHLKGHQTMVVMPNGLNSDYANHMEFGSGYPFANFFFDELMPFVYDAFPASSAPEDNYIAGFSMGGAGALMLGLLHPEKFGGIAPLGCSPREAGFLQDYLDMTGEAFRALAMADRRALPTEYGDPAQGITRKEINMIARYPSVRDYTASMECTGERFPEALAGGRLPPVFFCCGSEDGCAPKVRDFVRRAMEWGAGQVEGDILSGLDHSGSEAALARMLQRFQL